MSKEQIRKELAANGFRVAKEFDKLPWQHMMFLARDEQWTGRTSQRINSMARVSVAR